VFRTSLELNYVKRTFRPLYGWSQATPISGFLDPTWTRAVAIYPGMVLTKTSGNNYTLVGSASNATLANQVPAGFCAQFIGGYGTDELLEAGLNALAVWTLGPDAQFEVLAPAFDSAASWVDPADGTTFLIYAYVSGPNQGQLCPSGATTGGSVAGTTPVARLVQVESSTSLIIAGLNGRVA
jgi:hypothetical protein